MVIDQELVWRVPVTLPGRYFGAELAVTTAPAGTAEDAKTIAQSTLKQLKAYVPGCDLEVVGEPYR